MYRLCGHLGHVNHFKKLLFPYPKEDQNEVGQMVSDEKMFENADKDEIWVTLNQG